MELPRLRLRRVFEHGPSFKVQRAGMPALTIAKKALSPNLQAKLRKYAEGGNVTGEAAPAMEATQPIESMPEREGEIPVLPLPPAADPMQRAAVDFVSAGPSVESFKKLVEDTKDLPAAERERLLNFGKNVLAKQTMQAAQAEPVEPAAPAAIRRPRPRLGVQQESASAGPAAPVAAPAPAAELMGPPEMVGPPAPAGVPAAAPAMVAAAPVVPAAPVAPAAPAVPVAPAKPEVPEIKIPDTITGTTVEDFKEAIKANPQADPAAVATALVTAKAPQITPPNFDQITAAAPAGEGKTAIEKFDAAVAARAAALTEEAKADFETKQEMVRIAQASEARQLAATKKDADTAAKLAQRKESLEKAIGQGFQPQSMWGRMSAPQKVGSLISLAVGGFLSGYTDTKNYVYEAFNNLLENDLDVQKGNYNSLLKQYERLLGDEAAARKLAEADLLNLTALQVKSVEARSNLRGIGPQLAAVRADLEMKAAANREEVRKKMFDADIAQINADTQRGLRQAEEKAKLAKTAPKVAGGPTRGAVSAERLEFAKTRYLEGKRFVVPDPEDPNKSIEIKALNPTVAQRTAKEISQRASGAIKLEQFLKWLAQNRDEPASATKLREMQIKIKNVVEGYPGVARGSPSLVSVAQAKLLTPAIETPIVKYIDALGLTTTAIKELREDALLGINEAIRGAAEPDDPGYLKFKSKFSEKGFRGQTGLPATPEAAAKIYATAPTPSPEKTGEGDAMKMVKIKTKSGQIGAVPQSRLQEALSRGAVVVR